MINPQWLELPMPRTNFHGPKDIRAIEVRLYLLLFSAMQMYKYLPQSVKGMTFAEAIPKMETKVQIFHILVS